MGLSTNWKLIAGVLALFGQIAATYIWYGDINASAYQQFCAQQNAEARKEQQAED
jgi:hypothetical protein